jgi:hypothetical protein
MLRQLVQDLKRLETEYSAVKAKLEADAVRRAFKLNP